MNVRLNPKSALHSPEAPQSPTPQILAHSIPEGDVRFWAQTLQDLVAALLRDGGAGRIADAAGRALDDADIFDAEAAFAACGLRPGDTILLKARNDVQGVASLFAAWLAGLTVVPVDPSGGADIHRLLATAADAAAEVEMNGEVRRLDALPARRPLVADKPTGVDLALVIFTSGSSGAPKGVRLSHANVLSALRAIATYLEIDASDKILSIPPMFLDYGLYQPLLSLFTGCRVILGAGVSNPLKILSFIETARPTVLPVVPALASALARVLNTFQQSLGSLRLITNTGGHLAPATVAAMRRSFPDAAIAPMYGLTESKRALYLPPEWIDAKPGSVGGPMPGLDARVVIRTPAGELVEAAAGEVGELYVRGASVMQGYHNAAADAGARLIAGRYRDDNWLATGDLFERDDDDCLYFRGRAKSLIKQKGYCLYPRDLEAAAEAVEEVAGAVVVGRAEPDGDETAVMFLVTREPADEERRERIVEALRRRLHKSLHPGLVHFLDAWPASPVGKIDLNALRALAGGL